MRSGLQHIYAMLHFFHSDTAMLEDCVRCSEYLFTPIPCFALLKALVRPSVPRLVLASLVRQRLPIL